MINKGRIALVLGLVALITVGELRAADGDAGDPVRFSVGVEFEGTDNRDSTPDGDTNLDLFIRPKIDIISDTERTIFDFYYEPAYRYRTDPHPTQNDDEFQHDVGLKVKHNLGLSSRVRLDERYVFTDDPSVQAGGSTLRRDSSFSLNELGAGIAFDMGEKVLSDVDVQHVMKAYEDDFVAKESDEDSITASLKVMRFIQPTMGIYGSLALSQYGYEKENNVDRGFDATSLGVGMDRVISDYVRTGIQLGLTAVSYDDSTLDDDDSPYVGVNLQFQPTAQIKTLFSVNFALQNSDVYPYSSQETGNLYARCEWTGIERMKISVWGNYRTSQYDADNVPRSLLVAEGYTSAAQYMAVTGFKTEGDESTITLGVELVYNIEERTALKFVQLYDDIDSDVSTSYTRNATKLGVSRSF
jgi:hypothetical protein